MTTLKEILEKAVALGASDIHLTPDQRPVFRTQGQLVDSDFAPVDGEQMTRMVAEILPPFARKTFESMHEADFSHHLPGLGRFRVNVFLTKGIPAIAMRHVRTRIPTFADLRLPPQLASLAKLQRGIVLVSGTTGSGKSTTLAAVIGEINRTRRCRIITVEDPIEYVFENDQSVITQREVGLDTMSYENALVHLMRQDPDVILIGEMRDQRSVRTAVLAAETGHLVFSTLHASSSSLAVPRILDMFPSEEQTQIRMALAGTLHAVVCQRLMVDTAGRFLPCVEIMINTPTVRKLLEKNQLEVLSAAIETGGEDGMQSFNQSIYHLIKAGTVAEAEGMRFATNPEALKMNLRGIFLDEGRRILSSI
jgi:twitching motility protein PilT